MPSTNPARPATRLSRTTGRPRLGVAAAACLLAAGGAFVGARIARAQIEPAADAPQPSPPEVSAGFFRLPPGFRIELVASEPLLADPTGIAWDENGRLFVCELHGYNLEGHLDVEELNKSGVLDRAVRRIPAPPEARHAAEAETYGTVKLLEDADGDGRMDRARVWADRLPPCYGVVAARDGVIVTCAPGIVYLADRDGDGDAETRETLFTGFGRGALERGINTPRVWLDNWIWVGAGRGGEISGPGLDRPAHIGSTDFRFRADGSAIEPVTGATGTFGHAFTDFGDRFIITGSRHALYAAPLPYRALVRNPWIPGPATNADAADYTRIHPISAPHPWRLARSRDPAWVRFYGEHEAAASGLFTSACSPLIYRADAFPEAYRGSHFSCEPQNNVVHRCVIERDGAALRVRRAPGEEEREFLASTEKWFRPMHLALGPDGALWVVDMYREIIEDYSAIPRFLQQQYGLIRGDDRGRIWRVVHESTEPRPAPRLGDATGEELVRLTGDPNAWWRETAQRLLVERGDRRVAAALARQAREGATPQARLHALWTLEGLAALDAGTVARALGDPVAGVRVHALRLAGRFLDGDGALVDRALALVDDADAHVRLELAMALGETLDPRALEALARLAREHGGERWMAAAIASSCADTAGRLLSALLASSDGPGAAGDVLGLLASTVGARRDEVEVVSTLEAIARTADDAPGGLRERCLGALLEGLRRGRGAPSASERGWDALRRLLASPAASVRERALEVAGALGAADGPFLAGVFERAAGEAADAAAPLESRLAALRVLAGAPLEAKRAACADALGPRQPIELQLAAIDALAASDDAASGAAILEGWSRASPRVQEAALVAVFARADRLPALLDAIEEGEVGAAVLRAFQRVRLLEAADEALRDRARRLLGSGAASVGDDVFTRFGAALAGDRDPARGASVFREHCLSCHAVGGEGHAVGPDLAAERERADETILEDILAPSALITAGYGAYLVTTTDGRALSGVLASESATSLTLREAGGVEHTVLRRNVQALISAPVSLMPDNFALLLEPRDVADVIGYLRAAFGAQRPPGVVLFDDDAEFAARLTDGGGEASVVASGAFAGANALRVTPPQRYAARIPGWSFRIAERPGGPDEFRYLRLAWRTSGGDGVMVELAADGRWPPAESPERRYHAGRNTTAWRSHQVAEAAPAEWAVVTADLWRDNGEFTLTGIAPTAMGGVAFFDRIELLRSVSGLEGR